MSDLEQLRFFASEITLLYVEDEIEIQVEVAGYLRKLFKNVYVASNGEEALSLYKEHKCDILLTDIHMPKMDGLTLIEEVKEIDETQEFIIISAFSETKYFIDSINKNVHAYIIKPINFTQLNQTLLNLCMKINFQKENLKYKAHLEELVEDKTLEFKENFEHTIDSLVKLIEMRDTYTAGHSERVALYSSEIAKAMNYSQEECDFLYRAGILHDIGKISTPDTILLKPGTLTQIERSLIEVHVNEGYEMLRKIPMYKEMAELIQHHHERYDGLGYPIGLKGDEIPIFGHIMIIADAFDAMTSNRIYKKKLDVPMALEEIRKNSAKQFHPDLIEVACSTLEKAFQPDTVGTILDNTLQHERMAYHFLDPISHAYNFKYLLFLLKQEKSKEKYTCLHLMKFYNLEQYTKAHNWMDGDEILSILADTIKKHYRGGLLFHINSENFVLLFLEHTEIDKELLTKDPIIKEKALEPKFFHTDLSQYEEINDEVLENIFSDSNFL